MNKLSEHWIEKKFAYLNDLQRRVNYSHANMYFNYHNMIF